MPGAYTGTCHKMHLPSIFLNAYAIKDKGVDSIAIVSVNDAFVMSAWKRDTDQRGRGHLLADAGAVTSTRDRHGADASGNGLGIRSKRYSMLVEDGVAKKLNLEPASARSRSPAATRRWRSCELRRAALKEIMPGLVPGMMDHSDRGAPTSQPPAAAGPSATPSR